jgi:hypothetical protein
VNEIGDVKGVFWESVFSQLARLSNRRINEQSKTKHMDNMKSSETNEPDALDNG